MSKLFLGRVASKSLFSPASQKRKVAQTTLEPFQFQRVKDYIEENLGEDLSISHLAALIPMSQFHFARAFKASLGQTPHKYITQRRIERAKVLLSVTQLPVLEVAAQTGFFNPSHFAAQFRKHTGATPKQFRDSPAIFRSSRKQ